MTTQEINIGQEVVRTKGDYVVGRTGIVEALDLEKNRAQVDWNQSTKSWVAFASLELTSIAYEIIPFKEWKDYKGYYKWSQPKYVRL